MRIFEKEILVPRPAPGAPWIAHFAERCRRELGDAEAPIRFVVTRTDAAGCHCELAVVADPPSGALRDASVFAFQPRPFVRTEPFTAVLLVPTGIGAEIGGHAGDANPVARLLCSACDTLITHPNVVNASDINELPENGLYVEGSVLTRLLMGTCGLQKSRANRLLLVMDKHAEQIMAAPVTNALSAARATLGAHVARMVVPARPTAMKAQYAPSGRAAGEISDLDGLLNALVTYRDEYDAVALASVIDFPEELHRAYVQAGGEIVNPWGGVEAMLTHTISHQFNVPSAHAPVMGDSEVLKQIADVVDPRMAAEELSCAFIHCVLKGLHSAPRIVAEPRWIHAPGVINAADVSCVVVPDGCLGLPVLAALQHGIPIIAVRENRNRMRNDLTELPFRSGQLTIVDSYLEAAGVMTALRAGVALETIRRPLRPTRVTVE